MGTLNTPVEDTKEDSPHPKHQVPDRPLLGIPSINTTTTTTATTTTTLSRTFSSPACRGVNLYQMVFPAAKEASPCSGSPASRVAPTVVPVAGKVLIAAAKLSFSGRGGGHVFSTQRP